ncbi:MAG: hypothetical protein J6S69_09610 [Proteobacteria bacterium]|nr:hypothetical protein [Pseudomonadota bacterium]
MNLKKLHSLNRKGAAILVVMLIILSASAIALVSMHIMQNETKNALAFQYNRQAAQAANQVGLYLQGNVQEDALKESAQASRAGVENAIKIMDNESLDAQAAMEKASTAINNTANWKDRKNIRIFTGLSDNLSETPSVLKGDLNRSITQVASNGNQSLNPKPIAGFSKGDAYCSFTTQANAYALVGRSVPLRESGNERYYLLSDLNARVSGFKREMGLLRVEPLPCNN